MRSGVAFAVLLVGCFYDEASPLPADFGTCAPVPATAGVVAPTWYRDVEPIITAKCQGCHTGGGIAPFALADYHDVTSNNGAIRAAVDARVMPPWQPGPCCNKYLYDRSLSDADRATLLAWIDQGMPFGDPSDARLYEQQRMSLPRVDLHAEMAQPFTPKPQVGADELRCFLLDHEPIERTRYITGFDFQPGARAEVHHVIVYSVPEDKIGELVAKDGADGRPGWDCWGDGGELVGDKQYIGGWQPGVLPRLLPDGIGRELPAHTRIYVQIHYDTGHGIAPDRSAIDVMLEDHVDRVERAIPVGNPLWFAGDGMKIAAGDPDSHVWFAYDPSVLVTKGKSVEIHNVMHHMHELGSIGRVAILRKDGSTECLLDITHWDFHWMADYYFATPVRLDPGDKLYVECHWNNTAAHQKVVNGEQQEPRDLYWGTDDEMCGAVLTYSEAVTP